MARRTSANKEIESAAGRDEARRLWLRRAGGAALMVLVLAVMALGIAKLRDPHSFPIRTVQIEGEFRYLDPRAIEDAAMPHVRGGFFSIRLRSVEQALLALPWVQSVSLRRRWPGNLVIRVREQEPVARWGDDALLNPYGEVFSPPPEEFPDRLPQIRGLEGRARELLAELGRLRIALRDRGLDVRALSEDARRAREIELANGIAVALGRLDHEGRIRRLLEAYPEALAPQAGDIRRIDLRYTNGLAVEWNPSSDPSAGVESR